MKDCREICSFICALSILPLVCFSANFVPIDNYLIDCGSPTNTSIDSRNFSADSFYKNFLSTQQDILASTSLKSITSTRDSPLYSTARIFTAPSKYTFPINKKGRHWIRLYFFPFAYEKYDLSAAKFAVSTQNYNLLSDFSVLKNPVMKEYSLSVNSDTLVITFVPSDNSIAFVSAIEVVSVPDDLIIDDAFTLNPAGSYSGLFAQALETVFRVNMGGPTVSSGSDTLQRTWLPDKKFLIQPNLARNFTNIGAVKYVDGGPTANTAPPIVYGTLTQMNSADDPRSNFNVTWQFDVEPQFQYLVRLHFCDIISKSLNELYFNVYINSWFVAKDLDLSTRNNILGAPFFKDMITAPSASTKILVSIGPSTVSNDYPNAILNGLEIMKMNNSVSSLSSSTAVPLSSTSGSGSKKVGLIVGVSVGAFLAVFIVGVFFFLLCRKRKRSGKEGHSKTWIPLSINDGTSHTMGSKYSNATTGSAASNLGEMVNLAEWSMKWQKRGQLEQIIDPTLAGKIRPDSLRKFGETAEKCLADFGVDRPSMGDVLWNLEYALQLQEAVVQGDPEENSTNMIGELSPQVNNFDHEVSVSAAQFEATSLDDLSGVSMSRVFSQLVKSEGR
ncbi:hypothetical protein JHK85_031632 [Glycine max]|nr:hypothetical protein JHK85_031632 [Glycine max]